MLQSTRMRSSLCDGRAALRSVLLTQRSHRSVHACTCTMPSPTHLPKNIKVRSFAKKKKRVVHAVVGGKLIDEHETLAQKYGTPWNIRVAALVERLPVIMPDIKPWEQDYYDLKERRNMMRKEYPAPLWQPEEEDDPEEEELLEGTDQAKSKEEDGILWEPASRWTEADEKDDRTSLFRALQHRLFLIQRTPDKDLQMGGGEWRFVLGELPATDEELDAMQVNYTDGTQGRGSLPSCAISHVDDQLVHGVKDEEGNSILGDMESMVENGMQLYSITNTPVGYLPVPYSEEYQKQHDVYGAKVFFFRSQILTTDITTAEAKSGDDFHWITKDELGDYFDEECCGYLRNML